RSRAAGGNHAAPSRRPSTQPETDDGLGLFKPGANERRGRMFSRLARRALVVSATTMAMLVAVAGSALACGGLVAPGHAEVLQKATTLAAWHAGYEHYVTGFQFLGAARNFGYIIPLPGVPSKIEKGGGWTLERLEREINPAKRVLLFAAAATDVQVLQRVRVDALDITVVP